METTYISTHKENKMHMQLMKLYMYILLSHTAVIVVVFKQTTTNKTTLIEIISTILVLGAILGAILV